ncbi:hypothetical protein H0H92_015229 [Tricholoma furcatifolium]|nr:hypothetical protein H0H92_015229 [Tricholoma furcatifolium]
MPARTLQADSIALRENLSAHVPKIFEQAQISTANHQKNLVALYKLQTEAAKQQVKKGRDTFKLVGEKLFEEEIIRLLQRVVPVKKGVSQADRVVKFIGQYVQFVNQKHADERIAEEAEEEDDDDSMASRFTVRLLKFFLKGFQAKDKTVRFRVLQAVAEMVSHLGELDEDTYKKLRTSLLDRLNDREAPVRLQASIALSKLSVAEDPSEVAEGEQSMLEVLQDTLQYDPSA